MQRVLINFQSFVLGEAVEQILETSGDFHVTVVENPKDVVKKQFNMASTALLMEVSSCPGYLLVERMEIRRQIKQQDARCKIVLLVNEKAEKKLAEQVKQLKRDGLIDQFIYSSTSASFLAAIMDAL